MNRRPKFHFTPKTGWINDPNGLICIDGIYHLFYQYYPDGMVWGPMHWGHAVSKDLISWEELEIALYPDELGYIFSGSCILDEDNVSGFGKNALIAFYTNHNPQTGEQQQSIAYSLDYIHFTKYNHNPVINNSIDAPDYKKDFRDPKVFKNNIKGGYSMILSAGNILEFYHSYNLICWNKTGEFNPGEDGFDGICECPDCFRLNDKWILTLSSIISDDKVSLPLAERGFSNAHVMQYFVGEFDGDTFINTDKSTEPHVLDYGTDNYAMVSFSNLDETIMLGWGEHWDYAANVPANDYRGKMTIARRVKLANTKNGFRLAFEPVINSDITVKSYDRHPGDNISLFGIRIVILENQIIVDRSKSSMKTDFDEHLHMDNYNIFTAERFKGGACHIDVVCDEGYYEIFADDGLESFSVMTF